MKRRGPELGDLSSRFFAYVQLKEKDIIRTVEVSPINGNEKERGKFRCSILF
jgi:hypothetical protein